MPNTNLQPTVEDVAPRFRLKAFDEAVTPPVRRARRILDQVRSILLRTFDATITAPLRPKRRLIQQVHVIFNPESRNFDKVCSTIDVINQVIPYASRGSLRFLSSSRQLPFENADIELIGCGSGATVFLLKTKQGHKVLKIYRQSLGRRFHDLLEIVNVFKRKYEIVASWYNGRFDLVPAARFLILKGPLLGVPVAAALQAYVDGEKKDFFREFSDEQLLRLMREQEELRRQFAFFAERTLAVHSRDGLCLDLLGRNNVVLANSGKELRFALLDNGIFDLEFMKRKKPHIYRKLEAHVSRIRFLLRAITSFATYKFYVFCVLCSDLVCTLDRVADCAM